MKLAENVEGVKSFYAKPQNFKLNSVEKKNIVCGKKWKEGIFQKKNSKNNWSEKFSFETLFDEIGWLFPKILDLG